MFVFMNSWKISLIVGKNRYSSTNKQTLHCTRNSNYSNTDIAMKTVTKYKPNSICNSNCGSFSNNTLTLLKRKS